MKSFREAMEILNGRDRRKLENNTYLEKRDADTIAVKLHSTDVVTYHRNGRVVLNSGGWHTVTTKDRICAYSPVYVSQERGVWYMGMYPKKNPVLFHDGIVINKNGFTDGKKA